MTRKVTLNLNPEIRPKAAEYFVEAIAAAQHANPYKIMSYGGAVRGGKTFTSLAILIRLCYLFPESRWHIIREDFPKFESTTIPSLNKILNGSNNWHISRKSSNFYYQNKQTGGTIFLKAENIKIDPNLDWMQGLETNGILLEQAEELSEKTFNKALERTGSWYLPKMPRGMIFLTFNPTQKKFIKENIYLKWLNGELPGEYYFMQALPKDNPDVTDDQYAGWGMMAERYQKQFVEGDWSDFDGEDGRWLFAFNAKKNVGSVTWNPKAITYLSFDFNRSPIVCSAWQIIDNVIYGIRVIKLKDATIYRLCEEIDKHFHGGYFFVTGDYSGGTLTTMSEIHNFDVIKNYFNLSKSQIQVSINPRLEDSRMLCNSVLEKMPMIVDSENCKAFIDDANNCKAAPDNTIVKKNRQKEAEQADTLDTFRYFIHRSFREITKIFQK